MALADEQQFCLRWNNFQANITSQFETLRDEEDFTDVTIACDGQRIQAHKVVLSACSPFFKDLFKSNPCSHPIIFMRDVEARHIVALLEFMYAGEVNVAQTHLPAFLKTAESLKIRGLTDSPRETEPCLNGKDGDIYLAPQSKHLPTTLEKSQIPSPSTVTSSQDVPEVNLSNLCSPPSKKPCMTDAEFKKDDLQFLNCESRLVTDVRSCLEPKMEIPDYLSDVDLDDVGGDDNENDGVQRYYGSGDMTDLPGGMEVIAQSSGYANQIKQELGGHPGMRLRMRRSSEHYLPFSSSQPNRFFDDSPELSAILQNRHEGERRNRLIKLAEGIEIYEDQLRSVKWSDYRKLTRGLATILFSPAELATCSVTGQRWSRAGSNERPVKPALDRAKVQAIISYVATRFPMVEISRIKQVLAYKCKENSTAFKMKAIRYYGEHFNK